MAKTGGEGPTPKQFRFDNAVTKKDGITETMRVFTGEVQPEILPKDETVNLEDEFEDEEINFGLPEQTPSLKSINPNPDKITDAMFDLRQIPSLIPAPAQKRKEINKSEEPTKFDLGPAEGDQTIETVVKETAEKRTVLHKKNLLDALIRIKKEEEGKKKNK